MVLLEEGACFLEWDPVSEPWDGGLMDLVVDSGVVAISWWLTCEPLVCILLSGDFFKILPPLVDT